MVSKHFPHNVVSIDVIEKWSRGFCSNSRVCCFCKCVWDICIDRERSKTRSRVQNLSSSSFWFLLQIYLLNNIHGSFCESSFFTWFSETQQKDIMEGLHDEVTIFVSFHHQDIPVSLCMCICFPPAFFSIFPIVWKRETSIILMTADHFCHIWPLFFVIFCLSKTWMKLKLYHIFYAFLIA